MEQALTKVEWQAVYNKHKEHRHFMGFNTEADDAALRDIYRRTRHLQQYRRET